MGIPTHLSQDSHLSIQTIPTCQPQTPHTRKYKSAGWFNTFIKLFSFYRYLQQKSKLNKQNPFPSTSESYTVSLLSTAFTLASNLSSNARTSSVDFVLIN